MRNNTQNSIQLTRRKLMLASFAGVIAEATGPSALSQVLQEAKSTHKNVLLVAIDDLRPELGVYNAPLALSPNIDAFSETGLTFDQAFVHQAICAPSRATLMTGLRPDTTGIYGLRQPVSTVLPASSPILNRTFKNAGFETVSIGKIFHHITDVAEGWSQPAYDMMKDDATRARRMALSPETYLEGYKWGEAGNLDRHGTWRAPPFEGADVGDYAYADGNNTLHAMQRLHELAYTQKRFLMCFGFHRPHLPFFAPRKYWDLYDPADIEVPPLKTRPEGAPPYALASSGETRNYANTEQDRSEPFSDEFSRRMTHGYLACVSYIDSLFGELMRTLCKLKLEKETIVVVWGDHGYKLGEYGQYNKHTNYEVDVRVPLIVHVPGMETAGQRTSALVETVDIFPSLLELTGQSVPETLEGLSFKPLLKSPDRPWKTAAFHQYPRSANDSDGTGSTVRREMMGYAVRTDGFRYVAWVDRETGEVLFQELYDLKNDPDETVNVAREARFAEKVAELEQTRLAGWKSAKPV